MTLQSPWEWTAFVTTPPTPSHFCDRHPNLRRRRPEWVSTPGADLSRVRVPFPQRLLWVSPGNNAAPQNDGHESTRSPPPISTPSPSQPPPHNRARVDQDPHNMSAKSSNGRRLDDSTMKRGRVKNKAASAPPASKPSPPRLPNGRGAPPPPSRQPPGMKERRPRLPMTPMQRALSTGRSDSRGRGTFSTRAAGHGRGDARGVRGEEAEEGDEMSVEELQASIEELLGMQGLGSGSWNKSGVPAAVEREQRTLVREIKAMGRRGRWHDALQVIARAKYQGTQLNAIIYGCAISAVGRCGRWREALVLLEQMQEDNVEPDEHAYNAAIAACSSANQWERALALFRTMQHAAHKEGGEEREAKGRCAQGMPGDRGPTTAAAEGGAGVVATPGTVSYNAAITACARGMRTEEALSLFREMGDRGVPRDEISYNAAIDACAKGGLWRRGLELLSEMELAGFRPSIVSYNTVLGVCGRAGRWEEAAILIDAMRGGGRAQGPGGAVDKGRVTVSTDDADKQDRGSDLNINDGANVRSSKDSSSSVISTDLEQPERRASENPDEVSPGSGSPAEVMTTALTTAATGGDATRFATLLPMAPPPDVYSYNSCIAACRRGGQAGLARLFFHEMMSRDLRPDVNTLKSMLLDRVKFAEHVGNVGPAQGTDAELLGDICSDEKEERREKEPPQHCPTEAMNHDASVDYTASPPRWMQALSLLDAVNGEGLGPDPPCLSLALSECAKAGRWEESRNLLWDLHAATRPGDSLHPGMSRYNSVLSTLRNASPTCGEQRSAHNLPNQNLCDRSAPETAAGVIGIGRKGEQRGETKPATAVDRGGEARISAFEGNGFAGAKWSGAEGWWRGEVSAFLSDMRAAGVTPNDESYRCAIRCATDAAMIDGARSTALAETDVEAAAAGAIAKSGLHPIRRELM